MAARAGNAAALYVLGNCFEYGYGWEEDLSSAYRNYLEAAEKGHAQAMYHAGLCVRRYGDLPDDEGAAKWFAMAAANGVKEAEPKLK